MKALLFTTASALLLSGAGASAASLLLDFGPTTATTTSLTISPAHVTGSVPETETTWNTIISSVVGASLFYGDGTNSGIKLTLGQEASAGGGIIDFGTPVANIGLLGTGGNTTNQQSLLGAGSIYGATSDATNVTKDGIFGVTGSAIGLRIDGLAAGDYLIYAMGRNTNSNGGVSPMSFFANVGTLATSFNFSSLTGIAQANTTYPTATYAGQFTSFTEGENYVAINVTVATGQSVFLAVDGTGTETRGFLNAVQVVPEPSTAILLGGMSAMLLGFRRRRA